MMREIKQVIAIILTFFMLNDALPTGVKFMEASRLSSRPDINKETRAMSQNFHTVVFARKQKNVEVLKKILMDVSDPTSKKYGQHLTKDKIASLSKNPEAVDSILKYLARNNIHDVNTTRYDDYIIATATVQAWEEVFSTEFFEFSMSQRPGLKFVRSLHYSLPEELVDHVDTVFNTVQLPDHNAGRRLHFERVSMNEKKTMATGETNPDLLNSFYNIQDNTGNSLTNQAVYAILDQEFSPSDLTTFQNYYGLPQEGISSDVGGHVNNDACVADPNNCIEANLDVQYIMAVARSVPTIYYYWTGEDVWLDWIVAVASMSDPPDIFTISYGSYEAAFSSAYLQSFDVEAIKLGLAGTTVMAASGDDGVAGFLVRGGSLSCGYWASFPASSPYVTAVGGTMGPEYGNAEVACASNTGSSITTGGGFSHEHTLPAWQATQVATYFTTVSGTSKQPVSGYNPAKRGYPDVSLMANRYGVIANGALYRVSGTSASSPVFAGMVALVNSARRANGNSTLGWLNPALYSLSSDFVNDITSGDNRCLASGGCCSQGFYASVGWDPVTGLGSVNFENFKAAMLGIEPTAGVIDQGSNSKKQWVLTSGYKKEDCPGSSDLVTQTGYPTGECIIQYNNNKQPEYSVEYGCTDDEGTVIVYKFSDLNCTVEASFDTYSTGCSNTANNDLAQSQYLQCIRSNSLPVAKGTFIVERLFDYANSCPDTELSSFNTWRANHCFINNTDASFQLTTELELTKYTSTDCNSSYIQSSTILTEDCIETVHDISTSFAFFDTTNNGASVYYTVSKSSSSNGFSILGMDTTTSIAVIVAVGCVLLMLLATCLCYSCTNKRSAPVNNRGGIVCSVPSAEQGYNYHQAPVVVELVDGHQSV